MSARSPPSTNTNDYVFVEIYIFCISQDACLFTVVAGIKSLTYIDPCSVVLFEHVYGTCYINVDLLFMEIVDLFACQELKLISHLLKYIQ